MSENEKTVAQKLLDVAGNETTLFKTPKNEAWGRVRGTCMKIDSTAFRQFMKNQYYQMHGKTPHSEACKQAFEQLVGQALFDSSVQQVHNRVARLNDKIILDLARDHGISKIEVTAAGYKEGSTEIINFTRPDGMRALPLPEPGGEISELQKFVNVDSKRDFRLIVAWLVAALNPKISCPILNLQGEQGSAKSTTAKIIRSLIDPCDAMLISPPRKEKDIYIEAKYSRVICFDNLSGVKKWLSDTLCKICTGTGFTGRKLYTNSERTIFKVKRPIILNGIDDIATRGDLLDRSIVLNLPAIGSKDRKDERTLWSEFNEARPRILGCLLEALAEGLQMSVALDTLPRMADFAEWITRCEAAFDYNDGTLLADYNNNRGQAVETGLDSDPTAAAIRKILNNNNDDEWNGLATALVEKIKKVSDADERYLPSPQKLKSRLTRLAPALRQIGITWDREHTREGNEYVLRKIQINASHASHASQPPPGRSKPTNGREANVREREGNPKKLHNASHSKQPPEATSGECEACEANEAKKQKNLTDTNEEFNRKFNSYNEHPF